MENNTYKFRPEVWGGSECTINRVADQYFDQLEYAGHYTRPTDLDLIASLGIKKYRFPILWEKHQPALNGKIDWSWAERSLLSLYSHGIDPIAGLLHHGSGPSYTSLADPDFPQLFAAYAKKVAERFPDIQYYTPVNEPLTTARFSGLYGHWYPHGHDDGSFLRILLNEVKGTVLAMKEIRKVNPQAKLVQTEDLGKTYATPLLQYQAEFENHRRWLTFDLLCGRVNDRHPLWKYFKWAGIDTEELKFFSNNPCPPDIIGVNYYVTSERFLDEKVADYPHVTPGGNGKHKYVDIDAVRIPHTENSGLEKLLEEVTERYSIPVAITEVQLNCHREQQLRWFNHIIEKCARVNDGSQKIIAVTAWALLGAFGWNKLVTVPKGDYECGVFDLSSGEPRPTALYHLIRNYTGRKKKEFCIVNEPGWWQVPSRYVRQPLIAEAPYVFSASERSKPVLIIGKTGTLGAAYARLCEARGMNHRLLSRQDIDITSRQRIDEAIDKYRPWAIINAAGYVRVDDAENEPERCFKENAYGPESLALACAKHGIKFLTFSSDLVFNGSKKDPYVEDDHVSPLNVYGRSKVIAERLVLAGNPDALIIRTSAFFGPWDQYNFVYNVLQSLKAQQVFVAANDVTISPTYIPDLVHTSLDLMVDDERDIWHLANTGDITWSDLAREVAMRKKFDHHLIDSRSINSLNLRAPRPGYSVLNSNKGISLPSLESALERYFIHNEFHPD